MKIIVDADACPVMDEVVEVASEFNVPVWFVADYSHYLGFESPLVEVKLVDKARDSVDLYIINNADAGDIVVTQDIGLAGILTGKRVYVLSPTGRIFSPKKIETLLERRHLHRKLRQAGVRLKGGTSSFSKEDRSRFTKALTSLLRRLFPPSAQENKTCNNSE